MHTYDVIIVGAGPAGGQCARDLAKTGSRVLLIEKAQSFSVNNYSSGGAPLEIMQTFDLPQPIVGTFWKNLAISSSDDRHIWTSSQSCGVILDFMKLRSFLADETVRYGGEILLNRAYQRHQTQDGLTEVFATNHLSGKIETFQTKILVDATGVERKVLANEQYNKDRAIVATGIEYLIEVPTSLYAQYAQTLSFFLGIKWMPRGYAWIFPMEENRLKVGVIRYFANEKISPCEKSYSFYLNHLMQECLGSCDYPILDRHGKTLYYTPRQKDCRYQDNMIAIGDSISTLNPMACEGIRHAMISGKMAAKHIQRSLDGSFQPFRKYSEEMNRYFGLKWLASEIVMRHVYHQRQDIKTSLIFQVLKGFRLDEIMDFAFFYRMRKILKFSIQYILLLMRHKLKKLFKDRTKAISN
jgi:digeranylgeranylglycerophospholipid reductase